MSKLKNKLIYNFIEKQLILRDRLWLFVWIIGLSMVWLWNIAFLNTPALRQVEIAFFNMILISFLVITISTALSWGYTLFYQFSKPALRTTGNFILNLIRSIPQIVGILIGYVLLTILIQKEVLSNEYLIVLGMALILSIFIFPELTDLFLERIEHYRKSDFYNAMLVCGISEIHIINREILLRNSLSHLINKLISVFGMAIFLQCSIDFIISVGLSTEVSSVNFPATLGSLLAKIDSKQDILAIGYAITHWSHIDNLFFEHLQGITVAFLIVFSLVCTYHISNGYARRHKL